eukprot:3951165-Pyramimonas_sp.AAC.1
MIVNTPDVRRAILYSYSVSFVAVESGPALTLSDFVHNIREGFEHLGWASTSSGWALTKLPKSYPIVVAAMLQ